MPWWAKAAIGILWIQAVYFTFRTIGRIVNHIDWAIWSHEEAKCPTAYYEEHRGVYMVFFPGDIHDALSRGEEYRWMRIVNPALTFAPDSLRFYPERHTGRITDMIRLFEGWRIVHHNVQGAHFFVPCTAHQEKDWEEQLAKCRPLDMGEAHKLLQKEKERCAGTRLTAWWFFSRNLDRLRWA